MSTIDKTDPLSTRPIKEIEKPIPRSIKEYHVFLASPGDVGEERRHVRQFFDRYNRYTAHLWNVRFEVVDWENYSTIGVGRPQELITEQTLEKYRQSLVLVIGIMGQRFGTPTGNAESGTEEEFNWAMESHQKQGFPEIKWFFRKTDRLVMPIDPDEALKAVEQWKMVLAFRRRMQNLQNPVFYNEYPGPAGFRDVFENDLNGWLTDSSRPWVSERAATTKVATTTLSPPSKYYEKIERDFRRLDIAGIDNDRAFEIPLSEIYVRLRVMFDEDAPEETEAHESRPIDIQMAMLRYAKLVIVGDPGSGKSTFLKYIALMLARSFVTGNSNIALEKLSLPEPLPLPIFLSCWDLADFLKRRQQVRLTTLVEFVADRLGAYDYSVSTDDVEELLGSGNCCLLFDGLDEVPTDAGRASVSRLLEECVEQYGDNRFVVTSRIRAYTGGTILKGDFTRCDIQPFDADDRAEFIRNWVALLFRVPPEQVQVEGSEAGQEFDALTRGIEDSDRIRPLAVNPLLLTVIAIVHWNRKRLPQQRVDLYDECVDVLLGQRKQAEHIQHSRKVAALDEQREEQVYEERAWVRKRFAEIALHIVRQDGDRDEATKTDVIKLLAPRFIDQGAADEEQAATRAGLFLDRQELRSGLLVSRRAHSYGFVHLTFQEYLAAWQLSNKDFDDVARIIKPRLRMAKWFETLQLLGGQWAKDSDEKADRYVAWLLDNRGTTINDQAPVVALCANIVKDIRGVAELKPKTRSIFEEAVESTLDAFRQGSGVPAKTQLEILEALGQLGAAVKSHLIDATRASLFQVRRRAIEMLLPYLSDDDLFGMEHILEDRSKEPIKTYLRSLIDRDVERTAGVLGTLRSYGPKTHEAVYEMTGLFFACLPLSFLMESCDRFTRNVHGSAPLSTDRLSTKWLECLVEKYGNKRGVRQLAHDLGANSKSHYLRAPILRMIAEKWPDEVTRKLLAERAVKDEEEKPRIAALEALVAEWHDETTRKLLTECAVQDKHPDARRAAIKALGAEWRDETTRRLLTERAVEDKHPDARSAALAALVEKWADETTRKLLAERAVKDEEEKPRIAALVALGAVWPDETTRKLLTERAVRDESASLRVVALQTLIKRWPDKTTGKLLAEHAVQDVDKGPRCAALEALLMKRALGKVISEFGRIVFTRYLDTIVPYLDPAEPMSREHIGRAAEKAGVAADKIEETVRSLSEHMGWDITKGAGK